MSCAVIYVLILFPGDTSGTCYVETNGDLIISPNISGDKERIRWMHNGKKMVEWHKMRQQISEYSQFKNRTQLNTDTGDVTVTRVTTADSGLYKAEISIGGQIETFTQQVEVIDPVCNTSISCNKTGSTVTLVCEADGHLLSYSWSGPGLQNPENRSQIQISRENLGSSYTCVVKNPVSEEKQNYTAGDCSTRDRRGLVGAVFGVVLVLVGVYFCFSHKKQNPQLSRDENGIELQSNIITASEEERGTRQAEEPLMARVEDPSWKIHLEKESDVVEENHQPPTGVNRDGNQDQLLTHSSHDTAIHHISELKNKLEELNYKEQERGIMSERSLITHIHNLTTADKEEMKDLVSQ
ncbi:uncharacterized protein LOC114764972 [Denticeps clupeoides]|uniref:uncharacterized protein LOC114764972 n=1 Tax=Denticeps clupeoides TaxID=299321 RepID=UPI0010A3D593|nr:uncharacterized protein LOC114764972 [Denticeps clupeoides]